MRTDIITFRDENNCVAMPDTYSFIMTQPYIRHDKPTDDPGFYHRHQIHADTRWNMKQAVDKFLVQFRQIPNVVLLNKPAIKAHPGNGIYTHTMDVFYAVEGFPPADAKNNRMLGAMLYPWR